MRHTCPLLRIGLVGGSRTGDWLKVQSNEWLPGTLDHELGSHLVEQSNLVANEQVSGPAN